MTIQLPDDLERFVQDVVRVGRYAREDDVVRDALDRLRHDLPENTVVINQPENRPQSTDALRSLAEANLQQHMLKIGLLSQLPDTEADFDDPTDELITIEGEPVSETIIRERR